jgi:hypothetical protein
MAGLVADPAQLEDAGQLANSQELWNSIKPGPNSPTVLDQAREQYPILKGVDLGYTENPNNSGNYLEFWPPGETGDDKYPRPQALPMEKPGLEINRSDTRPIDVLGDVVSHHLVNTDPKISQYYQQFKGSLTPDQNDILREQYQRAQQHEGEKRPYDQWAETAGLPAYFRGYAFQQWPAEEASKYYTPEQLGRFDEMMGYLKGNK